MRTMMIGFMGLSGSGKSEQATRLVQTFGFRHLSSTILSDEVATGSALGLQIRAHMAAGTIVPPAMQAPLIRRKVASYIADAARLGTTLPGIASDGYPRTIEVARWLDEQPFGPGVDKPHLIYLKLNEDVARTRVANRNRPGDTPALIEARERVFWENLEPLVAHFTRYGRITMLDGSADAATIAAQVADTVAKLQD